MKRIESIIKSEVDQILELPPNNSIVLVEWLFGGLATPTSTVLHRTGTDGWLTTRELPGRPRDKYLDNAQVRSSLEGLDSPVFYLLEVGTP